MKCWIFISTPIVALLVHFRCGKRVIGLAAINVCTNIYTSIFRMHTKQPKDAANEIKLKFSKTHSTERSSLALVPFPIPQQPKCNQNHCYYLYVKHIIVFYWTRTTSIAHVLVHVAVAKSTKQTAKAKSSHLVCRVRFVYNFGKRSHFTILKFSFSAKCKLQSSHTIIQTIFTFAFEWRAAVASSRSDSLYCDIFLAKLWNVHKANYYYYYYY